MLLFLIFIAAAMFITALRIGVDIYWSKFRRNTVINRWTPDTCTCVLDYRWYRDCPLETRVHTLVRIYRPILKGEERAWVTILRWCWDVPNLLLQQLGIQRQYISVFRYKEGHCPAPHPHLRIGEIVDGTGFHRYHVITKNGADLWDKCLEDNPHWALYPHASEASSHESAPLISAESNS